MFLVNVLFGELMVPDGDIRLQTRIEIPTDGTALIREGLTIYGAHVIKDHIPQPMDGLKTIHRRSLWVAKGFHLTGRAASAAVGDIKVLHDHSPEAIYDTLARMAQDFQFAPPLIELHGIRGNYMNDKAAAARYTAISLSPFANDIFFKGIDVQALPMMKGMDVQEMEPQYLAPAIPLAMTIGNTTVGYGFGSRTPARNLASICDLADAFCQHILKGGVMHEFDIKKHADKLLPDFALENVITNYDELIAAYRQGNFDYRIDLEGVATLTKNQIHIFTLPVGHGFDVVERIRAAIDSAKDKSRDNPLGRWIEANVMDAQEGKDHVTISLKKTSATVFDAWEKIRRLIGFQDSFHSNPNYCNEAGYVYSLTPLNLLEIWYRKRHDLILSSKRRLLRSAFEAVRITEALLIVSRHVKDVIALLQSSDTKESAVAQLMKKYGLTQFQAEHIEKAPLNLLLRSATLSLETRAEELQTRIRTLQQSMLNIPAEIAATAADIKRRYSTPRRTRIPKYRGYVAVQNGCIQFETTSEVEEILGNFPNTPLQVYSYDGSHLVQVDEIGKFKFGNLSKHTTGDIYGLDFTGDSGYTVNIREDGATCAVKGVVPGRRSEGYFYTTKRSWMIHRSGLIEAVDVTTALSMRKTISRGAVTDVIYVYPYTKQTHYLIFACSDDKNILILQRVTAETTRVRFPPAGVIHTQHNDSGKDWYFSLPADCTNRLSARVFHILDAEALLGDDPIVRIDLGQSKWRKGNQALRMLA